MVAVQESVVLVTGANGGLGREFVAAALARGAKKVYASARSPREWDDPRIVSVALDVTSQESIDSAVRDAGDVSIVINNAGVSGRTPLTESTVDEVRGVYETNVFGPLAVAKAFAPVLAENGGGALVDILSVMSWVPRPGSYNTSKAAFWSVTNALRIELAPQGTLVVGAHLSFTETPMTEGLEVPKASAVDIVAAIYDGVERDDVEVLADEPSRRVKALLSGPVTEIATGLFERGGSGTPR